MDILEIVFVFFVCHLITIFFSFLHTLLDFLEWSGLLKTILGYFLLYESGGRKMDIPEFFLLITILLIFLSQLVIGFWEMISEVNIRIIFYGQQEESCTLTFD